MKIQTLSVVVGTTACNAHCPFCVSKMTPTQGVEGISNFNPKNLSKAMRFAQNNGVSTMLITGKGEPTLYPEDIDLVIDKGFKSFPFVELQTNGISLASEKLNTWLGKWSVNGLSTIILSVVHYEDQMNKRIYGDNYPNLKDLIAKLHNIGFSVRLSCIMIKDFIDTPDAVKDLLFFCKQNKVEQLTIRPVTTPDYSDNKEVYEWTKLHYICDQDNCKIERFIRNEGTLLLKLMHGSEVYDYKGQNICISNCLTHSSNTEEIRQLIYFPDAHLRYSWTYEGAILL